MSFIGDISDIASKYPAFRKKQALDAVFKNFAGDWDETNLPKELKSELVENCPLAINATILKSKDTLKALVDFKGDKIETVLMRHKDDRNTVCVSSQVGCALGCSFCETGRMGFKRNLSADEIVFQVLLFSRILKKTGERVTNVVFMGMGEPFLNYDQVIKAIKILNDKDLLDIGARRISISTSGVIDGIKRLASENIQVNLAVSIHSMDDKKRNLIMPVNKVNKVVDLLKALKLYAKKTNRKIMIEYSLFNGFNDSESDALTLSGGLAENIGKLFVVNLIKCSPNRGALRASSAEAQGKFKEVLKKQGVEVVERYRHGHSIFGACGQLATEKD